MGYRIQARGFYRTRSGAKARIDKVLKTLAIGVTGGINRTWGSTSGMYYVNGDTSPLDIVGEWVDPEPVIEPVVEPEPVLLSLQSLARLVLLHADWVREGQHGKRSFSEILDAADDFVSTVNERNAESN